MLKLALDTANTIRTLSWQNNWGTAVKPDPHTKFRWMWFANCALLTLLILLWTHPCLHGTPRQSHSQPQIPTWGRVWHPSNHSLVCWIDSSGFWTTNQIWGMWFFMWHWPAHVQCHNIMLTQLCKDTDRQARSRGWQSTYIFEFPSTGKLSARVWKGLDVQLGDKKELALYWKKLFCLYQFENLRPKYIGKS